MITVHCILTLRTSLAPRHCYCIQVHVHCHVLTVLHTYSVIIIMFYSYFNCLYFNCFYITGTYRQFTSLCSLLLRHWGLSLPDVVSLGTAGVIWRLSLCSLSRLVGVSVAALVWLSSRWILACCSPVYVCMYVCNVCWLAGWLAGARLG